MRDLHTSTLRAIVDDKAASHFSRRAARAELALRDDEDRHHDEMSIHPMAMQWLSCSAAHLMEESV